MIYIYYIYLLCSNVSSIMYNINNFFINPKKNRYQFNAYKIFFIQNHNVTKIVLSFFIKYLLFFKKKLFIYYECPNIIHQITYLYGLFSLLFKLKYCYKGRENNFLEQKIYKYCSLTILISN